MIQPRRAATSIAALVALCLTGFDEPRRSIDYHWPHARVAPMDSVRSRFAAPSGFRRIDATEGGFAAWLRGLPLKPDKGVVLLHDGQPKADQVSHVAVIDIDVGTKDLQQCADAVIRLRAEYLYSLGKYDAIHFRFTSGDVARYSDWRRGMRPKVKGNRVTWSRSVRADDSYGTFRKYLDVVFTYAGTMSLSKELKSVEDANSVRPGDVWIDAGSPGHAVIVLDVVQHESSDQRRMLLAQSYMPAQQIHVLINPKNADSCWYDVSASGDLVTPHWRFRANQLKRFK